MTVDTQKPTMRREKTNRRRDERRPWGVYWEGENRSGCYCSPHRRRNQNPRPKLRDDRAAMADTRIRPGAVDRRILPLPGVERGAAKTVSLARVDRGLHAHRCAPFPSLFLFR
jgi:hypothetical protein